MLLNTKGIFNPKKDYLTGNSEWVKENREWAELLQNTEIYTAMLELKEEVGSSKTTRQNVFMKEYRSSFASAEEALKMFEIVDRQKRIHDYDDEILRMEDTFRDNISNECLSKIKYKDCNEEVIKNFSKKYKKQIEEFAEYVKKIEKENPDIAENINLAFSSSAKYHRELFGNFTEKFEKDVRDKIKEYDSFSDYEKQMQNMIDEKGRIEITHCIDTQSRKVLEINPLSAEKEKYVKLGNHSDDWVKAFVKANREEGVVVDSLINATERYERPNKKDIFATFQATNGEFYTFVKFNEWEGTTREASEQEINEFHENKAKADMFASFKEITNKEFDQIIYDSYTVATGRDGLNENLTIQNEEGVYKTLTSHEDGKTSIRNATPKEIKMFEKSVDRHKNSLQESIKNDSKFANFNDTEIKSMLNRMFSDMSTVRNKIKGLGL